MTSFPYEQPPAMASPGELRALIESRRSVRRFTPELVPDAVIRDCLAACRTFPLAGRIAHRSWNLTV